jgi:hypothetical protein
MESSTQITYHARDNGSDLPSNESPLDQIEEF